MTICKHGINRDNTCSLCANEIAQQRADAYTQGFSGYIGGACYGNVPQMGSSGQSPLVGACTELSKIGPVPAMRYTATTDHGNAEAAEAGIWLTSVNLDGKTHCLPILATDERAIELMHAGFNLVEVDSLEQAMEAAEQQERRLQ